VDASAALQLAIVANGIGPQQSRTVDWPITSSVKFEGPVADGAGSIISG